MAIQIDGFPTYIAAEAIPYGYVVSLTGSAGLGQATVQKAVYDDAQTIIGVALADAASGEPVAIQPLGRGGVVRIAIEANETLAIGNVATMSTTVPGTIDNDGTISIGVVVKGGVSGSSDLALAEVQTWFPPVTIST